MSPARVRAAAWIGILAVVWLTVAGFLTTATVSRRKDG